MKKCGYKEDCFENGGKYWGHMGNVLCYHLCENKDKSSACYKFNCLVELYTNEDQRNK